MVDRTKLKEFLEKNVGKITFAKVDGTDRTMICTLDPSYLPVSPPVLAGGSGATVVQAPVNQEVLKVWEISKGWRSFKVANVISIEVMGLLTL